MNTGPPGGEPNILKLDRPPWKDLVEAKKGKKVGTKQLKELPWFKQPEGVQKRQIPPAKIPAGQILSRGKPLDKDKLYLVNSKEEKRERRMTKERFALQELIKDRERLIRPNLSKGETFLQGLMEQKGVEPYKLVRKIHLASVIPKLKNTRKQLSAWKNLAKMGNPGTKRRRNTGGLKMAALGLITGEYSEEILQDGKVRILAKSHNIARKADLGEVARAAGFCHVRHLKAALEALNKICRLANLNLDGSEVGEAEKVLKRSDVKGILGRAWDLGNEVEAMVTAYATGLINHPGGKLLRTGN